MTLLPSHLGPTILFLQPDLFLFCFDCSFVFSLHLPPRLPLALHTPGHCATRVGQCWPWAPAGHRGLAGPAQGQLVSGGRARIRELRTYSKNPEVSRTALCYWLFPNLLTGNIRVLIRSPDETQFPGPGLAMTDYHPEPQIGPWRKKNIRPIEAQKDPCPIGLGLWGPCPAILALTVRALRDHSM